jgi:hypothetical protein
METPQDGRAGRNPRGDRRSHRLRPRVDRLDRLCSHADFLAKGNGPSTDGHGAAPFSYQLAGSQRLPFASLNTVAQPCPAISLPFLVASPPPAMRLLPSAEIFTVPVTTGMGMLKTSFLAAPPKALRKRPAPGRGSRQRWPPRPYRKRAWPEPFRRGGGIRLIPPA